MKLLTRGTDIRSEVHSGVLLFRIRSYDGPRVFESPMHRNEDPCTPFRQESCRYTERPRDIGGKVKAKPVMSRVQAKHGLQNLGGTAAPEFFKRVKLGRGSSPAVGLQPGSRCPRPRTL